MSSIVKTTAIAVLSAATLAFAAVSTAQAGGGNGTEIRWERALERQVNERSAFSQRATTSVSDAEERSEALFSPYSHRGAEQLERERFPSGIEGGAN